MEPEIIEETPIVDLVTLSFTITNTRDNLITIAKHRGYQDLIPDPAAAPGTPLENMFIPNSVDPVDWLNQHIKDFIADAASQAFIDKARIAASLAAEAEAHQIKEIARASIS